MGLYGLRMWVEQSYKQVKGSLGWAEYQVRSDRAIQRHWNLVCCAFTFCWWHASHSSVKPEPVEAGASGSAATDLSNNLWVGEKKCHRATTPSQGGLASSTTAGAGLVRAVDDAATVLERVVNASTTC